MIDIIDDILEDNETFDNDSEGLYEHRKEPVSEP